MLLVSCFPNESNWKLPTFPYNHCLKSLRSSSRGINLSIKKKKDCLKMNCPRILKDLRHFGCNLKRSTLNYILFREKGKQGHWERQGKKRTKQILVNFETLYKCNFSLLERLFCRTDVNCTLVWRQSEVFKIKEVDIFISSQVAM